MSTSQFHKKLFGVALDLSDDPMSLELKRAWMTRTSEAEGSKSFLDPYDAVVDSLIDLINKHGIELAGKFPVPSWLWPKPKPLDFSNVTTQNFGDFYDSGGFSRLLSKLKVFVEKKIFPAIPIMVGVDHSATMSVISALTERYGTDKLSVIVLDQHFDAIPASVRMAETSGASSNYYANAFFGLPMSESKCKDQCCCGNFWAYLIEAGTVNPNNISFIGVADYPEKSTRHKNESLYKKTYLSFEERGCRFFKLKQFESPYVDSLTKFIGGGVKTPYLYVSFDLDVGSYNSILAARYMDRPGLSRNNIMDIASIINNICLRGNIDLVGLDVMEFNMHFLGAKSPGEFEDQTIPLIKGFIRTLLHSAIVVKSSSK